MHIPTSILHGAICPVTVCVSGAGVAASIYVANRSTSKPSLTIFAAVTTMVLALQMLNFPIANGISGHFIGGVLAVSLLGIPFAVISMALVLTLQAVVFGDGGVDALGANILNMALIGTGVCGFIWRSLQARGLNKGIALATASGVSIILASMACAFELSLSGVISLSKVMPAMLSTHLMIAGSEAIIALALSLVLEISGQRRYAVVCLVLGLLAFLVSPLASTLPDGLEHVLQLI